MDEYDVAKSLIVVVPGHAGGDGDAELQSAVDASKRHPGRLYFMGGGSHLNPVLQGTDANEVTSRIRNEFRKKAEEIMRMGATGFGEMLGLHICMSERHSYQFAAPDHPLYLLLADLAAKYDVPIDLHTEAVPENIPTPENLRRACSANPGTLPATIPALERLLSHNQTARIVWQHIGWDNTGYMTVGLLRNLLNLHPNLFLALRAEERLNQVGDGGPMPNRIVDEDWRLKPEWLDFFREFPDRFMIGGDEFIAGKSARAPKFPQSFEETWSLMDQLPDDLAQKIGRDNAARVYRLNGGYD
ncbi:amidohydrolase family protein [bacterium]|nr:amidohydrolase family protein [bacterium]